MITHIRLKNDPAVMVGHESRRLTVHHSPPRGISKQSAITRLRLRCQRRQLIVGDKAATCKVSILSQSTAPTLSEFQRRYSRVNTATWLHWKYVSDSTSSNCFLTVRCLTMHTPHQLEHSPLPMRQHSPKHRQGPYLRSCHRHGQMYSPLYKE